MKKSIKLLLAISIVFISSACVTTVRGNLDYENKLAAHRQYSSLPPKTIVTTSNDGRMYDYESHMESLLADEIKNQLEGKGYSTNKIRKKDLRTHKIYRDYDRVYDDFANELNSLYASPQMQKDEAFKISNKLQGEFSNLGKAIKNDVVVLAYYEEYIKSTAARVGSFMLDLASAALLGASAGASGAAELATFKLGIINISTGEVLWTNSSFKAKDAIGSGISNSIYSAEELDKYKAEYLVKTALSELPEKAKLGLERD